MSKINKKDKIKVKTNKLCMKNNLNLKIKMEIQNIKKKINKMKDLLIGIISRKNFSSSNQKR